MLKKIWPCNSICPLCLCIQETADHLLMKCNFTEALWQGFSSMFNLPHYVVLGSLEGLVDWVLHLSASGNGVKKREKKLGLLFFFWWKV
jgi:hypothetical protein